jgi:transposase
LCNGKLIKNIKGKKTAVKDCQWMQKRHSLGFVSTSFLPIRKLNNSELIVGTDQTGSIWLPLRPKKRRSAYGLLNLRLEVVLNDICSLAGLNIISEICQGESNPEKLASLSHGN